MYFGYFKVPAKRMIRSFGRSKLASKKRFDMTHTIRTATHRTDIAIHVQQILVDQCPTIAPYFSDVQEGVSLIRSTQC